MKFRVQLVRLGDLTDAPTVIVEADGAVQASRDAEVSNPGYVAVQAEIYEED